MKVAIALVMGLAAMAAAAPTVEDSIQKTLATKGSVNVILDMAASQTKNLRSAFTQQNHVYATRAAKLNAFYTLMKGHADEVQASVLSTLESLRAANPELEITQIWTTNQITVKNANAATLEALLANSEISEITEEKWIPLEAPRDLKVYENGAALPKAGEQWGILDIQADRVWAQGNEGQGAVIANIDTGVRYTHEALREGWRQDYGWYDPGSKSVAPNDGNGHGTHTMGTIAGRANGIGVAPKAQWIACKGCSTSSCSSADLLACGDWVACPTNTAGAQPDCSKAPHASSNSWGGGQADTWYNGVIDSWRAVDIAPLFSSGNSGPTCGTSNSPSDYLNAIAVGSTVQGGAVSSFSSVGPSRGGLTKPDIAAPGSAVISSYYTSDTAYSSLSGTSMACPHVAGLTALLYSVNPNLTVPQITKILTEGAVAHTPTGRNCGNIQESVFPNNAVGYGRINAVNAVAGVGKL